MRSPPAASVVIGVSYGYRAAVAVLTAVLIAVYTLAATQPANMGLALTWGAALALLASLMAWYDAWRPRRGAVHFANQEWVLALGDVECQGTLHVVLDLQMYILVKFKPAPEGLNFNSHLLHTAQQHLQQQWLHLEPKIRFGAPHAQKADWLAFRRAVYARAA
jgi:hypothetical protein